MNQFYLAGRYEDLPLLRDVGYCLLSQRMEGQDYPINMLTCRWLSGAYPQACTDHERRRQALMDLEDIKACTHFVLYSHLTEPLPTRQSHSVELGFALGLKEKKPALQIYLVGTRTGNVFHHLPGITYRATWEDLFRDLGCEGKLILTQAAPSQDLRVPAWAVSTAEPLRPVRTIDAPIT